MNILQLIISLSILVFIHELGHFAMARWFGARVEKFYLFFNPWFSLFKYKSKRTGTIYGLGWLPLGGYCQIAGMVDESLDKEGLKSEPQPDEFRSKPAWQRLLIMAGGVIFNLILAMIIYVGIAFAWGDKHLDSSRVHAGWEFSAVAEDLGFEDGDIILSIDGKTRLNALSPRFNAELIEARQVQVLRYNRDTISIAMPNDVMERVLAHGEAFASMNIPFVVDTVLRSEAEEAGIKPGDSILVINGIGTPTARSVQEALSQLRGQEAEIMVVPTGHRHTEHDSSESCCPRTEGEIAFYRVPVDTAGLIGVVARTPLDVYPVEQINYSLLSAIPAGIGRATSTIQSYVGSLKYVFTKEGAKSMGGLGTMAKLFPTGFDWLAFWSVTAFLSIILAVMNLLPIPALDGGHILFILIEMITRRKLSDKVMMYIQMTGMILLLLLMLLANGNDVYRYLIK